MPKIHFSLEMSPQLHDLITELAERTGQSKANLLRQAVALMEVAVEASEQGKAFGVFGEDGALEREVTGIGL
jgi:predicted transcriptional regulator